MGWKQEVSASMKRKKRRSGWGGGRRRRRSLFGSFKPFKKVWRSLW